MANYPRLIVLTLISITYLYIIKPLLFLFDAERIHNFFINIGEKFGNYSIIKKILKCIFVVEKSILKQVILGINFNNPVGLAAGFDVNARLTQILPSMGFGYQTVGSITYKPCKGNSKPRFGRLPNSKSLMVNKGLQNEGVRVIINRLAELKLFMPVGISIARIDYSSNSTFEDEISDYVRTIEDLKQSNVGNYYELNISCPNIFVGELFTKPEKLNILLSKIDELKLTKPLFIKMPVDFSEEKTEMICNVANTHNVQGLIIGNLTKDRNNPALQHSEVKKFPVGNFSGKPTEERCNKLIKYTYKKYRNRFVIIGCGGVFNAEDAYKKIKLGASLIQLITGMIFNGPQVIAKINFDLIELLRKDGYTNIKQAIGSEVK